MFNKCSSSEAVRMSIREADRRQKADEKIEHIDSKTIPQLEQMKCLKIVPATKTHGKSRSLSLSSVIQGYHQAQGSVKEILQNI